MLVSRELRKSNMAEYLLYMWQVEDLIRANGFDAVKLVALTAPAGTDAALLDEWRVWYEDLIRMMTDEGVREKGHLQINMNVLILMSDLHGRVLDSEGCSEYKRRYYDALPAIVGYRAKSDGMQKGELESCFDFMYGMWMLRLGHRDVSAGTADAAARISGFLALLSSYYDRDRRGELDLEHEE